MNNPIPDKLNALLQTPGPSGEESRIQAECARQLADVVPTISKDIHGNQYYPLTSGHGRTVMICAHVDEIGLMVQGIDDDGFIRIVAVGGVDVNTLSGQRVRIGTVPGVIGRRAIHLRNKEDDEKPLSMDQLWVDIGAKTKAEAEGLVTIGGAFTLDTPVTPLRNNRLTARGLDNRIGVFVLLECMRRLALRTVSINVIGVTSVQEEIGLRGATTGGHQVDPDVAINVDVNFATDHPTGDPERYGDTRLSLGPILARGAGVNPRLLTEFQRVATKKNIPVQVRAEPDANGTDAGALQLVREGVAVMDLGIPNRYMHTAVEMVDLDDVYHCIDLITEWVVQCRPGTDYIPR